MKLRLCIAAFALAAGCVPSFAVPAGAQLICGAGIACPDGYECRQPAGRCVLAGSISAAPTLTAQPPLPLAGKAGTEFVVVFDVSKPLSQAPSVTLEMRGRSELLSRDDAMSSDLHEVYRYRAKGNEPEGFAKLYADLVDLDFNSAVDPSLGGLTLDFTNPGVAAAAVSYAPGAGNPLGSATAGKSGTTIFVTVIADEAVAGKDAEPPVLTAANAAGSRLDFTLSSLNSSGATFTATVKATDTDGRYVPTLSWSDVAGNRAAGLSFAQPPIEVKTSSPSLLVDQASVVYLRSASGNARSETLGDGGFELPAGAFSALAPADPLSSVASLPPNTFSLNGEPLTQIRIWADPDAGLLIGIAQPFDGGAWPRLQLANVDRPQVFATGVDRAGNESATVKIVNTEWVATPNPPAFPFGQPPHRFEWTGAAQRQLALNPLTGSLAGPGAEGLDGTAIVARAEVSWHDLERSGANPAARYHHAMAYDSARGRVVLFGGFAGVSRQDVWEWDGVNWVDKTPAGTKPTARAGHRMTYDSARGRVVLFGGSDGVIKQDLWEWDGATWVDRTPTGAKPPARADFAMAYDSKRGRVVLFGGKAAVALQDVWEWDGATWVDKTPVGTKPGARTFHAMAFDSGRGQMVLFGGFSAGLKQDIWEWDGTAWTDRTPAGTKPSPRYSHGMTYDTTRSRVVVFGGFTGANQQDTWEWDGTTWVDRTPVGVNPVARVNHAIVYDSARSKVVLFGGSDGAVRQDVWEFDGVKWLELTSTGAKPTARAGYSMAYDSARRRVVIFGGLEKFDAFLPGVMKQDVWEWDGVNWQDKTPAGLKPTARILSAMTYDSARARVVLFGGGDGILKNDLWEWDGTVWVDKTPLGTKPSGRSRHTLVDDSTRGRVMLFGGNDSVDRQDLWEWDGTGWLDKTPLGAKPSARRLHAMAYDSARAKIVVVGGFSGTANTNDVWEWDGTAWLNPMPAGPRPSIRSFHALVYDGARARTVLFGGSNIGLYPQDLWEWDGTRWLETTPSALKPPVRDGHAMVYDSARSRMVTFSGGSTVLGQDTWELEANPARQAAIQFTASSASAGITAASVTGLRVRAHCGGSFSPYGTGDTGATLRGWATGGAAPVQPGEWRVLSSNVIGVAASVPWLPPPPAALLDWKASDAAEARRFFRERDGQLAFQCRPAGSSGAVDREASVALDYLEVWVRYQLP